MSSFPDKVALIIEDDQTSVLVLKQFLIQLQIETEVIADSFSIQEQLAQIQRPDVIFLDLEMPQSNGYTVLQYIQQNATLEGVPIVAYTTHVSHLNEAKRAGFHSFIGKPLDKSLFPDQMERIFNNVRVWEVP